MRGPSKKNLHWEVYAYFLGQDMNLVEPGLLETTTLIA